MKLGFIGLGNMGSGMAKNLLAKGFDVLGFDTDETKNNELKESGLQIANSLQELVATSDLVILCLPNPEVSRDVLANQILVNNNKISTIVETSTLTPEIAAEFANICTDNNKQFLSAPMIGGKYHASTASIEFLIEGPEKLYMDMTTIFSAMGSNSRYMGDIPSATLAKLTFNMSRYANLAVGVETHRLLEKYGANIPAIYEFMTVHSLDNFGQVWAEDLKEMMISNVPFKPSQVPKKDLQLLTDMALSQNLDAQLIKAIRDTYLSME